MRALGRPLIVGVAVAAAAPVLEAALGNPNDIVKVFDTVRFEQGTSSATLADRQIVQGR